MSVWKIVFQLCGGLDAVFMYVGVHCEHVSRFLLRYVAGMPRQHAAAVQRSEDKFHSTAP